MWKLYQNKYRLHAHKRKQHQNLSPVSSNIENHNITTQFERLVINYGGLRLIYGANLTLHVVVHYKQCKQGAFYIYTHTCRSAG